MGFLPYGREALRRARLALRTSLFAAASVVPNKLKRLQNLPVYVLDNSIRESTVGQVCVVKGSQQPRPF